MTTSKSGLDPATLNADDSPIINNSSAPIPLPTDNPWDDVASLEAANKKMPIKPLSSLDPSLYDQPIFAGLKQDRVPLTPEPRNGGPGEALSEFDPLVSEEKAAREAWETSEGHPPPRTESPPLPSLKDLHISSATSPEASSPDAIASASPASATVSSSSFPSFASFAKTFSLGRRPLSIDATAGNPAPDRLDTGKSNASGPESSTPNPSGSGAASPIPKPADGAFDFQRFLDQMKSKSAEPVSKYLRSYVWSFRKILHPITRYL